MADEPHPFILCFEDHSANGRVWAVKHGKNWIHARCVIVRVPIETVYLGPDAPQPKAFLRGVGVVRRDGDTLMIDA